MKCRKNQIGWLHVLMSVLIVVGLPALIDRGRDISQWTFKTSSAQRLEFDDSYITDLQDKRPDHVFIGNSMLESRIAPETLDILEPGKTHYLLSKHGTGSTVWYLFLKYHLIASGIEPERVFIFFRDVELTNPDVEALCTWATEQWIHLLPCDDEPFDRIFGGQPIGWKDRTDSLVRRLYPVRARQEEADLYLRKLSSKGWVEPPPDMPPEEALDFRMRETWRIQKAVNDLFVLDKLRSLTNDTVYDPNADPTLYDFHYRLARSFLPEMISLAHQNDIEIFFIRNKRRPDPFTAITYQSQELLAYMDDLREYLADNDCFFYDFTDDKDLDVSWYANEDHVKHDLKTRYTGRFFMSLQEIVP